jgi:hypothetical protein
MTMSSATRAATRSPSGQGRISRGRTRSSARRSGLRGAAGDPPKSCRPPRRMGPPCRRCASRCRRRGWRSPRGCVGIPPIPRRRRTRCGRRSSRWVARRLARRRSCRCPAIRPERRSPTWRSVLTAMRWSSGARETPGAQSTVAAFERRRGRPTAHFNSWGRCRPRASGQSSRGSRWTPAGERPSCGGRSRLPASRSCTPRNAAPPGPSTLRRSPRRAIVPSAVRSWRSTVTGRRTLSSGRARERCCGRRARGANRFKRCARSPRVQRPLNRLYRLRQMARRWWSSPGRSESWSGAHDRRGAISAARTTSTAHILDRRSHPTPITSRCRRWQSRTGKRWRLGPRCLTGRARWDGTSSTTPRSAWPAMTRPPLTRT